MQTSETDNCSKMQKQRLVSRFAATNIEYHAINTFICFLIVANTATLVLEAKKPN